MATTDKWTYVHTTLPLELPRCAARTATLTERLLIRPLATSDLTALHTLMTQPEVMQWTAAGRAHTSLAETERKLAAFVAPEGDTSSFNFAICLRKDDSEGELVGIGGVHRFSRMMGDGLEGGYGWPELGYLFKKELWGRGFATEFVTAFLGMWDGLKRDRVDMGVNGKCLGDDDGDTWEKILVKDEDEIEEVREMLVAMIESRNGASRRVLEKCGFEHFDDFTEKHREDPDKSVDLLAFRYFPRIVGNVQEAS